jgi:hypothetical protein
LEGENTQLQDDRGTQWVKLQAELKQARSETTQARDEAKRLQKELDRASSAMARAEERSRRQKKPASGWAGLPGCVKSASLSDSKAWTPEGGPPSTWTRLAGVG